jgi:hypothetical protein
VWAENLGVGYARGAECVYLVVRTKWVVTKRARGGKGVDAEDARLVWAWCAPATIAEIINKLIRKLVETVAAPIGR